MYLVSELMVLGFISLILTFGQNYISKICIPEKIGDTMLPCPNRSAGNEEHKSASGAEAEHHRRLLWYKHRMLSGDSPPQGCKKVRSTNSNLVIVLRTHVWLCKLIAFMHVAIFVVNIHHFLTIRLIPWKHEAYILSSLWKIVFCVTGICATYVNQWNTSTTYLHILFGCIPCHLQCYNNDARKIEGEVYWFLCYNKRIFILVLMEESDHSWDFYIFNHGFFPNHGRPYLFYLVNLFGIICILVLFFVKSFVQIRGWKEWERQTVNEYEVSNGIL